MWIWIANKVAKFHAKRLTGVTEMKIFLKVLGGYFFEAPGRPMWLPVASPRAMGSPIMLYKLLLLGGTWSYIMNVTEIINKINHY